MRKNDSNYSGSVVCTFSLPGEQKLMKHSKAKLKLWYKYQFYCPSDKRSDGFGFVHFPGKKEMDKFILDNRLTR